MASHHHRDAALLAPGSIAAHDELRVATTLWRLAEAAFDAFPTAERARDAGEAFKAVVAYAESCGMLLSEPNVERWVSRRLTTYAAMIRANLADTQALVSVVTPIRVGVR